jgi:hypothetical protein
MIKFRAGPIHIRMLLFSVLKTEMHTAIILPVLLVRNSISYSEERI